MPEPDTKAIEQRLAQVVDAHTGLPLGDTATVKVAAGGNAVNVEVMLGYPAASHADAIRDEIKQVVKQAFGIVADRVTIRWNIVAHSVQRNLKVLDNVKNIIAVASGKGGVGKSTTAVNLALALSAEGANIGILDADIYGPSQPSMLGITGQPESKDKRTLEPVVRYNLQSMSIGFLIDSDTPMIWRGPMVTQALEQLLTDTNWRKVDYLIVDLPPGTGDIQLTLAQKIPVSGAVIVTTPQNIALLDAYRSIKMFEKVNVPVLGVIENMGLHICSRCGHEEHIFGADGGQTIARDFGVELLGSLPLDPRIREQTDDGNPTVIAEPNGRVAAIYRAIAYKLAANLAARGKDYSGKFPEIVVQ